MRVGQLEKAARERMEPTSQADTEGVVPGDPRGGGQVLMGTQWIKRKRSLLKLSNVLHI
jgi:hypothetical protein